MAICLAQQPDADALLDQNPLALLLGMLFDQQFPMERAFFGPYLVEQRLREPVAPPLAAQARPDQPGPPFTGPPAVHRYPGSMAQRTQALCRLLVEQYDGEVERLWTDV